MEGTRVIVKLNEKGFLNDARCNSHIELYCIDYSGTVVSQTEP